MIDLNLDALAQVVGGVVPADVPTRVDAIATDSRQVPHGAPLFIALKTETADGHQFVNAAANAGAVAALVSEPTSATIPTVQVDDTWQALRLLAGHVRQVVAPASVAITGSLGKTTVKDLTTAAVGASRRVHAATGSFNNELGVPLTLLGLEPNDDVLIAEIGARHEGDIAALAPIVAPDVAVVTAVAPVHLEVFGSLAAVGRAKSELVAALGPNGTAILNADDATVAAMAQLAPQSLTVGLDTDADVRATDIRLDVWARPRATAVTPWGTTELSVAVAGRHHLRNGLLALAVAGHLGVDIDAAAAAIGDATVSRWRGELVELDGVLVLDDAYNANPTAMRAALETLTAIDRPGQTYAVLGEMGEIGPTSRADHRNIGAAVTEADIDHLVTVGPNAQAIAEGAQATGHASVTEVADGEAAAQLLAGKLEPGDVVLVKASRVAGLETVMQQLRTVASSRKARR